MLSPWVPTTSPSGGSPGAISPRSADASPRASPGRGVSAVRIRVHTCSGGTARAAGGLGGARGHGPHAPRRRRAVTAARSCTTAAQTRQGGLGDRENARLLEGILSRRPDSNWRPAVSEVAFISARRGEFSNVLTRFVPPSTAPLPRPLLHALLHGQRGDAMQLISTSRPRPARSRCAVRSDGGCLLP